MAMPAVAKAAKEARAKVRNEAFHIAACQQRLRLQEKPEQR
jgi:hypothetical protein